MNFFEAQDFFKKLYPKKIVTFEFDENCIQQIECIYTESRLHVYNHVEYQKVKVHVFGQEEFYVPIDPHRAIINAVDVKNKIAKDDVYIHENDLKIAKDLLNSKDPLFDVKIKEIAQHSGLSEDVIIKRLV